MKKRFLGILLSFSLVLSLLPSMIWAAEIEGFSDMPAKDHWSYAALNAAVENGLLQGSDGKLMPQGALTRAQMAAVINRAFGAQTTANIDRFTDVSKNAWYYADIAKAVQMGTFAGDANNTMRPDASISRQEAFAVLARAFKLPEGDVSVLAKFADQGDVAGYARTSLAAMVQAGYVGGTDGKLLPTATMTREQFAQALYSMLSAYIGKAGTFTEDISGNAMINTPDVTLKGITIAGDLIIGEGVGNGDVTLDDVTIEGRLVVRGGGENSIHIINHTKVGSIIVNKTGDKGVRVRTEEGCLIDVVYVNDGRDNVILEGSFKKIEINTDKVVTLNNALVTDVAVSAPNADVKIEGKSDISTISIKESATGTELTVNSGAKVTLVDSAANNVTISGSGTVTQATISGNNNTINTVGTVLTGNEETPKVTEVATEAEFKDALNDSKVKDIRITADITIIGEINSTVLNVNKTVVVAAGKTLYLAAYKPGGTVPDGVIANNLFINTGGSIKLESGAILMADRNISPEGEPFYMCRADINIFGGTIDASEGIVTTTSTGEMARIYYDSGNLIMPKGFTDKDDKVFVVYHVDDLAGLIAANEISYCDFIYLQGDDPITLDADFVISKILDVDIPGEASFVIPAGVTMTTNGEFSIYPDTTLVVNGVLVVNSEFNVMGGANIVNTGKISQPTQ